MCSSLPVKIHPFPTVCVFKQDFFFFFKKKSLFDLMQSARTRFNKTFQNDNEDPGGGLKNDTPRWIESWIDGKMCTLIMSILTIFTLWGDDLRLCAFTKDADDIFEGLFTFSIVAFFIEFLLNSISKPGYKWGFFFFLDLIAVLSLVPDIPWFMNVISLITTGSGNNIKVGRGLASARTARVVRLVRLIRLIRIVKLYSMVNRAQETEQEEKQKAQARAAQNAKQAALKNVEASRLGNVLSEYTTRRVIVGVLLILFLTPFLRIDETDQSMRAGLTQLFWLGRSNCTVDSINSVKPFEIFGCRDQGDRTEFTQVAGWKNYVWLFSQVIGKHFIYATRFDIVFLENL